jgi:hypothetical protein
MLTRPLDVAAEVKAIQAALPPGPLRWHQYQRLVSRIERTRAQARDVGAKHRLGQKALYVKALARKERSHGDAPEFDW